MKMQEQCHRNLVVLDDAPQCWRNPLTVVGYFCSSANWWWSAQKALAVESGWCGHTSGRLSPGTPSSTFVTGNMQCGKTSFRFPSTDQQCPQEKKKKQKKNNFFSLHHHQYFKLLLLLLAFLATFRGRCVTVKTCLCLINNLFDKNFLVSVFVESPLAEPIWGWFPCFTLQFRSEEHFSDMLPCKLCWVPYMMTELAWNNIGVRRMRKVQVILILPAPS